MRQHPAIRQTLGDSKTTMDTTGASGVAAWKMLIGLAGIGAIGAGLAAVVVMCCTPPRSKREWTVGLICTVLGSIAGGAGVIQHFNLEHWAYSPIGLVAMLGLVFTCGLPAWAIVRWMFNYLDKKQGATIMDVADDIRQRLP